MTLPVNGRSAALRTTQKSTGGEPVRGFRAGQSPAVKAATTSTSRRTPRAPADISDMRQLITTAIMHAWPEHCSHRTSRLPPREKFPDADRAAASTTQEMSQTI